ncbi:MAG: transposase [Patescibacteria group bacterium]
MRKELFGVGEYYHVYNRGVDGRNIVLDEKDADRFIEGLIEFNTITPIGSIYENSFSKVRENSRSNLVNIICYCLNPNHFHMILEEIVEGGISLFMSKQIGGYVKFLNNRHKRRGTLFEGRFKAKHIDNNDYLLHSSAYVNLNDKVHQLGNNKIVRSSWKEYSEGLGNICVKKIILEQFTEGIEYKKFCLDNLPYMLEKRASYKELQNLFKE